MSEYHRVNHYIIRDDFIDFITENMGGETPEETASDVIERIINGCTYDATLRRLLKRIAAMHNIEEAIEDLVYPDEIEVDVVSERIVRSRSQFTVTFDDKEDYEIYKEDPEAYIIEHYMDHVEEYEYSRDETDESLEVEEV